MKSKITSFLLVVALCALITVNVQAETSISPTIDKIQGKEVVPVETSEYYESEKIKNKDQNSVQSNRINSKGLKLHFNNNKEIKNDIVLSDDSSKTIEQKQKLVAVLEDSFNNTIHYYFSDNLSASDKDILNKIASDIEKIDNPEADSTLMKSSSIPTDIREYHWLFYGDKSQVQTTLDTKVFLNKKISNASFEGESCSIWDVIALSEYVNVNARRINRQKTRLDVSHPGESIFGYGPTASRSFGTVSVGLNMSGSPYTSYNFRLDGFSVEDLSSLADDYGMWEFNDKFGNESHFITKPAISAVNTKGSFIVELSHVVTFNTGLFGLGSGETGLVQIHVNDR